MDDSVRNVQGEMMIIIFFMCVTLERSIKGSFCILSFPPPVSLKKNNTEKEREVSSHITMKIV